MGNTINERLKIVRTTLKLSQREFSKGVFLRQSSYARIEQGLVNANERIIELACSKFKVSKAYLKDGKLPMFSENPPDVKLEQLNGIFDELNPLFREYLINQAKELLKVQIQQAQETSAKTIKNTKKNH